MKHRSGFMLIEVMIATLIATIIAAALFVVLDQINRATVVTQNYADIYAKAAIVNKQFERDLAGFFLPLASQKDITEKKSEVPKDKPSAANQPDDKNKKQVEPEKKSDEKPIKKITKVFYAKNKDKNLELLTFITNNPMQVYWSDKSGKAKPRAARVVYRLMPDKEFKNSFVLSRQEGSGLYFDSYNKQDKSGSRQFEMIDGIKSFAIEYAVEKPSPSDDKASEKKDEQVKPKDYIMKKEWKDEQAKEENAASSDDKKTEKKEKKQFPEFVVIKMALWDDQKKRDTQFEFRIPLVAQGQQPAEPQESIAARLLEQTKAQAQPAAGQPNAPAGGPQLGAKARGMPGAHSMQTAQNTNKPVPGKIYMTMEEINARLASGDTTLLNQLNNHEIMIKGSAAGASHV
ncbi:MAG: hypothetical protein P4L31_04035 [Candidatus Babeliales bacterium]|nr:hypothetical protein [Candidatus Babeliales bacterium]